jgi:hypothetical protein
MQRMSAIATKTNSFVKLLEGTNTKMIPRKTTPVRVAEKWAVKWVGRESPFALYDMLDESIFLQVEYYVTKPLGKTDLKISKPET